MKKQPSLILLFKHTLTAAQEADARDSLGIGQIVEPPADISARWAGAPPEADSLGDWLAPAFALGLTPIYSTTGREAVEEYMPDGSVHIKHIFSHVRYRLYAPQIGIAQRFLQEDTP